MDGERPKLNFTSSWDDGDALDYKVGQLLLEHDLPGTFYLPSITAIEDVVKMMIGNGFEIGGHTVSHPQDLKELDDDMLNYEIMANKDQLETAAGRPITKFCYPRGRYDDRVIAAVKKAGYTYGRTTEVLKVDVKDTDPFKMPTTIHVFHRREYQGVDIWEVAKNYAKHAAQAGGLFHIWGHSWEIDQLNQWEEMGDFFYWLTSNYQIIKN